MFSTYRLKVDQLNNNFIKSIKHLFHDKEVEIIVHDIEDETEYILRNEDNKKRILQAIQNIEDPANVVEVNINDLI